MSFCIDEITGVNIIIGYLTGDIGYPMFLDEHINSDRIYNANVYNIS